MANVNIQLNRAYVVAGSVITATGGPYTVASNGEITVLDSDEAAVRTDIAALLQPAGASSIPAPFVFSQGAIDLVNVSTKQAVFTVPTGRRAIITAIVVRDATSDASAASIAAGFNADANDVAASATIGALNAPFPGGQALISTGGFGIGAAGDVFGVKLTVPAAGACLATIEAIGYFI